MTAIWTPVLYLVEQTGVACHTGESHVFLQILGRSIKKLPSLAHQSFQQKPLNDVYAVIKDRKLNPKDGLIR